MLNTRSSSFNLCRKLKLNIDDTEPIKYFCCPNLNCIHIHHGTVFSTCNFARCSKCGNLMSHKITVKNSTSNTRVGRTDDSEFVSNVTTFIVTDDLRVMPNTSGFVIQLFRRYGITDACYIEERTLNIGVEQVMPYMIYFLLF